MKKKISGTDQLLAESILNDLILASERRPDRVRLNSTIKLSKVDNPEIKALLTGLYNKKGGLARRLTATVLNAVFFEQKATFLFSKRILARLIASDKNLGRTSINGEEYKDLWAYLVGGKILEVVKMPPKGTKAAALLTLKHLGLISLFDKGFGDNLRELQKKECSDVINGYIEDLPIRLPKRSSTDNDSEIENDSESEFDLDSSGTVQLEDQQKLSLKNTKVPGELAELLAQVDYCHKSKKNHKFPPEIQSDLNRLYEVIFDPDTSEATQKLFSGWYLRQFDCKMPLSKRRLTALVHQEEWISGENQNGPTPLFDKNDNVYWSDDEGGD